MATVLLLMDAFRYDYISQQETPFLWRCSQSGEYYKCVEPSLGYCERAEILSGLKGHESGYFTAVGFDPDNSDYKNVRYLPFFEKSESIILQFLSVLPIEYSDKIHKKMRRLILRYFQRKGVSMPCYSIPFSWLPYFSLTEDKEDHRSADAFPEPSILAMLDKAGREYYYDTFTALNFSSPYNTDSERLNAVINDIKKCPKDLYLVYISSPDVYGHKYGPSSYSLKKELRNLDENLSVFSNKLLESDESHEFVFLGDHGMKTVEKHFDAGSEIKSFLKSVGLRHGVDVVYFLDSTIVRIWGLNDKALKLLPSIMEGSNEFNDNGEWITQSKSIKYNVVWGDRRYGDIIWLASSGTLVYPDFFHRFKASVGMHGYNPRLAESQGMCIRWGNNISPVRHDKIHLSDVYDILKTSLKL